MDSSDIIVVDDMGLINSERGGGSRGKIGPQSICMYVCRSDGITAKPFELGTWNLD